MRIESGRFRRPMGMIQCEYIPVRTRSESVVCRYLSEYEGNDHAS